MPVGASHKLSQLPGLILYVCLGLSLHLQRGAQRLVRQSSIGRKCISTSLSSITLDVSNKVSAIF